MKKITTLLAAMLLTACAPFTPEQQAEYDAVLKYRRSLPAACRQPEAKCDMFLPNGEVVRITDMPEVSK